MPDPPYIVTLALNRDAFVFFNELRQKYFPPERNFLEAHLTLFHQLPGNTHEVSETLTQAALQSTISLSVAAVVCIGNGVAYQMISTELVQLHQALQQQWKSVLTRQDAQRLWPHITIQNKVAPAEAKQLQQQLQKEFIPFFAYGTGLCLWQYLGGPWKFLNFFPFNEKM